MLTGRAWWFFLITFAALLLGLWTSPPLGLATLTLLVWFGAEWLGFNVRVHRLTPTLQVEREISDERSTAATLWVGRTFTVRVIVRAASRFQLSHAAVVDRPPFGCDVVDGENSAAGPLGAGRSLRFSYRIRCTTPGVARFEGVRLQGTDLQGMFSLTMFLRKPVALMVLPTLAWRGGKAVSTKWINELSPPGAHRLRRPGSGSELLELRDYLPGDPPKTIAWKVSARRDRLITREYESEVPIRCTLLLDVSNSVRLASTPRSGDLHNRPARPLDRLVEIAAGVVQANVRGRDLTVLCLFDEVSATVVRPDRTGPHLTQMLNRLAEAAALGPTAVRVNPRTLLSLAHAFAREVYPDLLTPEVNGAPPWWAVWFGAYPMRTRRRPRWNEFLQRTKATVYFTACVIAPILCAAAFAFVFYLVVSRQIAPPLLRTALGLATLTSAVVGGCGFLYFFAAVVASGMLRRRMLSRKALAAVLTLRYGPTTGGIAALLEDDDLFSIALQRFLSDHRVPYSLPLYDESGAYLFAATKKVDVLATALLQAVGRGRDNELFVLLVDLIELDDRLGPLVRAVGVALSRRHQVLLVCPWPPGIETPDESEPQPLLLVPPKTPGRRFLKHLTSVHFHAAYHRLRHTFGRLGVQVVCAAVGEPTALILDRLERLRQARRSWR